MLGQHRRRRCCNISDSLSQLPQKCDDIDVYFVVIRLVYVYRNANTIEQFRKLIVKLPEM